MKESFGDLTGRNTEVIGPWARAPAAEAPLGKAGAGGGKDLTPQKRPGTCFSNQATIGRLVSKPHRAQRSAWGLAGSAAGMVGSYWPLGTSPVLALGIQGWGVRKWSGPGQAKGAEALEEAAPGRFCD